MTKRCFWIALFKNENLMFLKLSTERNDQNIWVILTSRKQSHVKIPWFCHDFSIIFKFHDFSMHGIFSVIFHVFQSLWEPWYDQDREPDTDKCNSKRTYFENVLSFIKKKQIQLKIQTALILWFYWVYQQFRFLLRNKNSHFTHNEVWRSSLSQSFKISTTVMILSFRTDRPRQTVQTQIRLLLEQQSDQGLHCLPFRLHRLDSLVYGKAT